MQLDGQPVTLKSGSIHYSRVHPGLWRDRLVRLQAMGLNTVQVYAPWNFHVVLPATPQNQQFDFGQIDPWRNISAFLSLTQELGLNVLMRPGACIQQLARLVAHILRLRLRASSSPPSSLLPKYVYDIPCRPLHVRRVGGGRVPLLPVEHARHRVSHQQHRVLVAGGPVVVCNLDADQAPPAIQRRQRVDVAVGERVRQLRSVPSPPVPAYIQTGLQECLFQSKVRS